MTDLYIIHLESSSDGSHAMFSITGFIIKFFHPACINISALTQVVRPHPRASWLLQFETYHLEKGKSNFVSDAINMSERLSETESIGLK